MLTAEYDYNLDIEVQRDEAWSAGRSEGKVEGKAEDILILLQELGEVSSELAARIREEKGTEALTKWLKIAARAETIQEFTELAFN